jgi:glucose-induced degradation protein 8
MMLKEESGTQPKVELEAIKERMEIRRTLQSGDIEKAIDMVNELNPEVRSFKRFS